MLWALFMQGGPVSFLLSCRRKEHGNIDSVLFCFMLQHLSGLRFYSIVDELAIFFLGPLSICAVQLARLDSQSFSIRRCLNGSHLRFGQRGPPPFKFLHLSERASEASAYPVITTFALLYGGLKLSSVSTAVFSVPYKRSTPPHVGSGLVEMVVSALFLWWYFFDVLQR